MDNNIALTDAEINVLRNALLAREMPEYPKRYSEDELQALLFKLNEALAHPQTVFE